MSERAYLRLHHNFKRATHRMNGGGYQSVFERTDVLDDAVSFTSNDRELIEDVGTGLTWRDDYDGNVIGVLWTIAGIKDFIASLRNNPPPTDSDVEQLVTDLSRVIELYDLGEVDNHGDSNHPAVWFDFL